MSFQFGDLIVNKYASGSNPGKVTMVLSVKNKRIHAVDKNGHIVHHPLGDKYYDGTEALVKIGELKINDFINIVDDFSYGRRVIGCE